MGAVVNRPWSTTVRLTLSGAPVAGVPVGALTLKVWKPGETVFLPRTLAAPEWVEIGDGFYAILWTDDDMDTLGEFRFFLTGAPFDPVTGAFDVEPAPFETLASPAVCVISGNVFDLGGQPVQNVALVFRPLKLPSVINTSFVATGLIRATPDAYGNFSVALLRKASVLVELEPAGLRAQFTVPDQETALLVDVIPPIA